MKPSKELKIGDKIWYAIYQLRPVQIKCIVCYGEKIVTLILGNGDHVQLACEFCSSGAEPPCGYTSEYECEPKAEQKIITNIQIEQTTDGETRRYLAGHSCLDPDDMFDNERDALTRAEAKKVEYDEQAALCKRNARSGSNKSYTWHAGYWRREAKRARENAATYDKYVTVCEAHARSKKKGRK